MKITAIALALSASTLFACGGGGGGGSKSDGYSGDTYNGVKQDLSESRTPIEQISYTNVPANRQQEWDQYIVRINAKIAASIDGLSDTSVSRPSEGYVDQNYLYIENDGKGNRTATAYNFMHDSADSEGDCYRLSQFNDVNALFNINGSGMSLTVDPFYQSATKEGEIHAYFAGQKDNVTWHYDAQGNPRWASYGATKVVNSPTTKNLFVVDGSNTINVQIYKNSSDITINYIKQNMCKNERVHPLIVGSNKYVGLYDINHQSNAIPPKPVTAYMYISETGKVSSYELSATQNCYQTAINGEANYEIHGKQLTYEKAASTFYTTLRNGTKVIWNLDTLGRIVSVGTSKSQTLDDGQNQVYISAKPASITIESIRQMQCK